MLHSRRFLFQTAFGSGTDAGFPPLAPDDDFAIRPPPVLATSRGRLEVSVPPGAGELVVAGAFSAVLDCVLGAELFALRKVLLTLTALKEAGFLTAEEPRPWLFASSLVLEASDLAASLSDPPLMLTSVEFTKSSTMSEMCLFSNSSVAEAAASPFTCGRLASTFCETVSILVVCGRVRGTCG